MQEKIKNIYKLVDTKQGDDIKIIDFRNNSPYVDYFLICSARNSRLAKAIIEEVEEYAYKNNIEVLSKSVEKDGKWMLIDLNDIIVHVFVLDERDKYNLEGLWKDLIVEL